MEGAPGTRRPLDRGVGVLILRLSNPVNHVSHMQALLSPF